MFIILNHFTTFSQIKPNNMENANLDFGKIILRVLVLIIVKPFVLPIQIYMNTLRNLSSHDDENSNQITCCFFALLPSPDSSGNPFYFSLKI